MKGDKKVIECLNQALANEMVAIYQYITHAKLYQHWGFAQLGTTVRAQSLDEMRHADVLIDRILFLDGRPALEGTKPTIGSTMQEMLAADLRLEVKAVADLKHAIHCSESAKDYGSQNLFQTILDSEEEHIHWIETQLTLIEHVGIQNYQQSQVQNSQPTGDNP